jgi:alpha-aminoadipic semialdehyde synthase
MTTRTRIGLRLEDKNEWERRVALTPSNVAALVERGVEVAVEPFARRTFADREYVEAGAELVEDVRPCELVLGIKEMPTGYFRRGGAYMFFSHTIKGQPFNMKMLADLVRKECTLIDHELVADAKGRRLIFFGRFAGIAGMIDTLWTLGQRLEALGTSTPFAGLQPTHRYGGFEEAKAAMSEVARRLEQEPVPAALTPMVFGFAGYGHVSQGAQEVFDLLPHVEVAPEELAGFVARNGRSDHELIKVVYREEHLVERIDSRAPFDLQEYYDQPERYRSAFEPHLRLLTVLVNGIFWNESYPKLADAGQLRALFADATRPKLLVVGDITCDVDGSLACTVRDTHSGDPVYVYDPATREAASGFTGPGLSVMAVGNLPAELPREASMAFGGALAPFMPQVARADLAGSLADAALPGPIERAVVLWRGEFTPQYEYMKDFLD